MVAAPRVADGRDVVDVDAESRAWRSRSLSCCPAPGFDRRDGRKLRRDCVGFICGHVDPDQRRERDIELRRPARSIDQRRCPDHLAPGALDRGNCFARGQTRRHHIFDQQHPFALTQPEPAAKLEHPLRALDEHRRLAERARQLLADDHTAHRRRHDRLDPLPNLGRQLLGQGPRQPLGPRRVHQDSRALQVARASKARGEDEMSSSRASASRNSARISSSVIAAPQFDARNRPARSRLQPRGEAKSDQALEEQGTPSYRARNHRGCIPAPSVPTARLPG